jgi:hypothetical protein
MLRVSAVVETGDTGVGMGRGEVTGIVGKISRVGKGEGMITIAAGGGVDVGVGEGVKVGLGVAEGAGVWVEVGDRSVFNVGEGVEVGRCGLGEDNTAALTEAGSASGCESRPNPRIIPANERAAAAAITVTVR